jgi:TPR repeat protein
MHTKQLHIISFQPIKATPRLKLSTPLSRDRRRGANANLSTAASYDQRSAEQQNSAGHWRCGRCSQRGRGGAQDKAQATHDYRLSADQQNTIGQWRDGRCLEHGFEVTKKTAQAARYYRLSADQ